MQQKKNRQDFIKDFNASKDTMKKVKRQITEWQKIFANYIFYKGLLSKIQKEHPLERLAFKK